MTLRRGRASAKATGRVMSDRPRTTEPDGTLANIGRLVPFLEHLQERRGARPEWRKRERQWLTILLAKPVIPFSDVQLAAELLARHHWEDVRRSEESGSPRCLEALKRLYEIRSRRNGITVAHRRNLSKR
jgi:hypothetical protein